MTQTRGMTPALMEPRLQRGGMSPAQCARAMQTSARQDAPVQARMQKTKMAMAKSGRGHAVQAVMKAMRGR